MKKLMLHKDKAMACLILLCLFITQSCQKGQESVPGSAKINLVTDLAIINGLVKIL